LSHGGLKVDEIKEFEDNCMIIRVLPDSPRLKEQGLYEAVRRCWRAVKEKSEKAKYVLAIVSTIQDKKLEVKGVFECTHWYYLGGEFCQKMLNECQQEYKTNTDLCKNSKRIAFDGDEITDDVKYLHKLLPENYFPLQNPYRYTYK
jgi:hypothetical protein